MHQVAPVGSDEDWGRFRAEAGDAAPAEVLRLMIGMANEQLAPDDPYRLTWDMVDGLQRVAGLLLCSGRSFGGLDHSFFLNLASVLAAYLPPRERPSPAAMIVTT